jgi:hypothetical protein
MVKGWKTNVVLLCVCDSIAGTGTGGQGIGEQRTTRTPLTALMDMHWTSTTLSSVLRLSDGGRGLGAGPAGELACEWTEKIHSTSCSL